MAGAASVMGNMAMPSAAAAPCPDAEVIFARGTMEAPGVGDTGDAFVNSLRANVGAKSVDVYPVDYPATTDFPTAVQGIADARARIMTTAATCPDTKMVLGGFSQGAAVIGFVTASVVPDGVSVADVPAPMPPDVADHVSAVALFGKPSPRFMKVLNNPSVVVGPRYTAKAIRPVCRQRSGVRSPGQELRYPHPVRGSRPGEPGGGIRGEQASGRLGAGGGSAGAAGHAGGYRTVAGVAGATGPARAGSAARTAHGPGPAEPSRPGTGAESHGADACRTRAGRTGAGGTTPDCAGVAD